MVCMLARAEEGSALEAATSATVTMVTPRNSSSLEEVILRLSNSSNPTASVLGLMTDDGWMRPVRGFVENLHGNQHHERRVLTRVRRESRTSTCSHHVNLLLLVNGMSANVEMPQWFQPKHGDAQME
jgi:hypothetical protein